MDNQKVASKINGDIEDHVYDLFPRMKTRMQFIANKLIKSKYVVNTEAQLSSGELRTLKENDYI